MTITLTQFKSGFGVPNPSPFCMKAEVLLKMSCVNYKSNILDDPSKGPKGKLPFITDDGKIIADSELIKKHIETEYNVDFDEGLSLEQKSISHAFARMAEERLYWVLVYSRWIDENNWPIINDFWFGGMPPILRNIIPVIAKKGVKSSLKGHGLGRHSKSEIYAFGAKDIASIAGLLGDHDYIFGDSPSALDATLYPMLANAALEELPSPLIDNIKSHSNLMPYIERCHKRWFD